MNISITGSNVFLSGRDVVPYAVSPWGPTTLATWGMGSGSEQRIVKEAYGELLALQASPAYSGRHAMQKAYADITQRAIVNSEIIQTLLDQPTSIPDAPEENRLARELNMTARLIEYAQSTLNHQRQVFLVAAGGYDNHDGLVDEGGELGPHTIRMAELNEAIMYFWNALDIINMRDQVTAFTASDFGRTYVSNGDGSDHGWSAPHFVIGGSQVNGGNLYGGFPDLTIDGPHDTGHGRYIPAHSVDEYAFEMAKWIGVPLSEMATVFPNLDRFVDIQNPSTHLGILT
jgi:uncharacterized protein (DUF1501 family)